MEENFGFRDLDDIVHQARKAFRGNDSKQMQDVAKVLTVCFVFLKFAKVSKQLPKLTSERQDDLIKTFVRAVQMVIGILYLSESGLYDLGGGLLRNYTELTLLSIAIGFDEQCYFDWKNDRKGFRTFSNLRMRVERSAQVPDTHKQGALVFCTEYWNKASVFFSHQLGKEALDGALVGTQINLGVVVPDKGWQNKRLGLIIVLGINLCTLMNQLFDYSDLSAQRKEKPDMVNPTEIYDQLFREYQGIDEVG